MFTPELESVKWSWHIIRLFGGVRHLNSSCNVFGLVGNCFIENFWGNLMSEHNNSISTSLQRLHWGFLRLACQNICLFSPPSKQFTEISFLSVGWWGIFTTGKVLMDTGKYFHSLKVGGSILVISGLHCLLSSLLTWLDLCKQICSVVHCGKTLSSLNSLISPRESTSWCLFQWIGHPLYVPTTVQERCYWSIVKGIIVEQAGHLVMSELRSNLRWPVLGTWHHRSQLLAS